MTAQDSQANETSPHPFTQTLLRWIAAQRGTENLPAELLAKLTELPASEQSRCLSELCGYCVALIDAGRLQRGRAVLSGAKRILRTLPALVVGVEKEFLLARLAAARAVGDLDTMLELLPGLRGSVESDIEAMLQFYRELHDLREQLTPQIGIEHAMCLCVLLQPVDRSVALEIFEGEQWVHSRDFRDLLLALLPQASAALQQSLHHLLRLIDAGTASSPEAQVRQNAGRIRAVALIELSKRTLSAGDAEGMFLAADRLDVPEITTDEVDGLLTVLHDHDRRTVPGVIPAWLTWRGAQKARWPGELLAHFTLDVLDLMRPAAGDYAVLKRRKELAEYALKHAGESETTLWQARLYYALMHICVRLSEFEGDTPELVNKQYLAGRRAMSLFLQTRDVETAAQCVDLMLLAQTRVPPENGGGLRNTLAYIDKLLVPQASDSDKAEGPPPLIRAALLLCRHRLSRDSQNQQEEYPQRKADLEEAFQIFSSEGGEHMQENVVRVCSFLADLEFKHALHGAPKSFAEARSWSDRGLDLIDAQRDPEGFVILVMSHVQILLQQEEFAAALHWIQKAMALPGITSTFRASLLVDRVRVRLQEDTKSVESLRAGLQELGEATRLLGPAQNEELRWSIIRGQIQLHEELGEPQAAVHAIQRGLRAWQHILSPTHRADLRAELIPLLQRRREDGRTDEAEAAHELDGLLVDAQTVPWDALSRVCDAAWQWLYYHCLHAKHLMYTADRATALETLSRSAGVRASLNLLIDVWRGRATGTPPLPQLFAQIEAAIVNEPRNTEPYLGLGFYLALRECKAEVEIQEHWAARLEACLLALPDNDGSTGSVDFLITLANVRLDSRAEQAAPSLVSAQAAIRLLEKAESVYPKERLSPSLRRRLTRAWLLARMRCLGLTPGQDAHKLALEAQLLVCESEVLEPSERIGFLEELYHWLVRYAAPNATPLRAYAQELRQSYGVGDHDEERAAKLDRLTELSKADRVKLQALREQGVPKELAQNLLRGEHMAQLTLADARFSDQGLDVLMPLLSQATAATDAPWRLSFTARVHRALGWLWIRHRSQERRRTVAEAIKHFERAAALWPSTDPDGFLDMAHEYAAAIWRFETKGTDERKQYADRAEEVIRSALSHPRAAEFPLRQAMLYRQLGLVEQHREHFVRHPGDARFARMLKYHEQALALCPPTEVDEYFQILLTLANACRDGYRGLRESESDQSLVERAITTYREALALSDRLRRSPPTEPARAKKCLADALMMRSQGSDLDEAKVLLLESLEVRTEQHYPVPRAESLISLAELELLRHAAGVPEALDAARQAAVQCQTILAADASPGLEQSVAALLRRIEHLTGDRAVDAVGRGRPGPPLLQRLLEELSDQVPNRPPLDPRLHNMGIFEGNMAASVLFSITGKRLTASLKLRDEFSSETENELYVPVEAVLARIEAAVSDGDTRKARQYLDATFTSLCGNAADFSASAHKRLFHFTKELIPDPFLEQQPWDSAAMWRHQAVHTLHGSWSLLDPAQWDWLERQERAAVAALESHASEDPYLPEYWKTLALVLWKRPHEAFRRRHREALGLLQKALTLARKQDQSSLVVSLLNDVATLLHELSREEPALLQLSIQHYTEIINKTGVKGKELDHHQLALGNRAWARIELPREQQPQGFRDAVQDLEKALALCADSPFFLRSRGHHYLHLGLAHTELDAYEPGHRQRAIECLQASLEISQTIKDSVDEARALHNMGLLFLRMGGPAELMQAKDFLGDALTKRRGRPIEEWETLGTLVAVRMRANVPFGRLRDDQALLRQVESLLAALKKQQLPERALTTHQYLFDLVRHQADPDVGELTRRCEQALQYAEEAWALASRTATQHLFSQGISLWAARRAVLAHDEGAPAVQILRHSQRGKARTLRWQRSVLLDLPHALRSAHADRLTTLQQLRRSSRPEDSAAALLLEEEMLTLLRGQWTETPQADVDDARLIQRLRETPQTAFIDLSVTDFGSVCVRAYLGRDGQLIVDSKRLSLSTHEIHRVLSNDPKTGRLGWHATLEQVGDAMMHRGATDAELIDKLETGHAICMQKLSWLSSEVIAPITADLLASGIVDLVFCLPGLLGQLPIVAAYRLDSDGSPHYLIEDFRSVALVPAAESFVAKSKPSASNLRRAATVVTESSLPAEAAASAERLASRLRTLGISIRELREVGQGRELAIPTFATEAIAEFNLVHFACHGQFKSQDVENAGLVLAGGQVLSTSRLIHHPMSTPADLVVLAACRSGQTATNDLGGEWLGFSGALLRIGVRDVVAALWDVETRSTMRLLDSFYDHFLEQRDRPAICLGFAMREQVRLGRQGESGGAHPLTARASEHVQLRLRRLCASPLWWGGLVAMQSR